MRSTMQWTAGLAATGVMVLVGCTAMQPAEPGPKGMSFFVTSAGPGKGADLGGLEGADRHCQALATAAGAGKGGTEGSAMTGHHDRAGTINNAWAVSWNSSHPTRGCDPQGLRSTGGDGLYYCFAAK